MTDYITIYSIQKAVTMHVCKPYISAKASLHTAKQETMYNEKEYLIHVNIQKKCCWYDLQLMIDVSQSGINRYHALLSWMRLSLFFLQTGEPHTL